MNFLSWAPYFSGNEPKGKSVRTPEAERLLNESHPTKLAPEGGYGDAAREVDITVRRNARIGLIEASQAYREFRKHGRPNDAEALTSICRKRNVPAAASQFLREVHESDPEAASRLAEAAIALPKVDSHFLGFYLIEELGRGGFGTVFLARQDDLAGRPVALKISADLRGESQTLARLQHTNIVPIYSVHRAEPLQAVCMPYFGRTTLADVFEGLSKGPLPVSGKHLVSTVQGRRNSTKLEGRGTSGEGRETRDEGRRAGSEHQEASVNTATSSLATDSSPLATHPSPLAPAASLAALEKLSGFTYVEAILWLGVRIADGLAHAHERGIIHRDLKPANVLLTDEGEPMLLDFNLSEDAELRNTPIGARLGGTLPYMSPEQLEAFQEGDRPIDARSDIYSLGLLLYELLTGRRPFRTPTTIMHELLPLMLADRRKEAPELRSHNPAVSPAVEAIVRRCLQPVREQRYQSAKDLREDLQRQLDNLPLKHETEPSLRERVGKFRRRHRTLTSTTSLGICAILLLAASGYGSLQIHSRYARLDALDGRSESSKDLDQGKFQLDRMEPDRKQVEDGRQAYWRFLKRYPIVDLSELAANQVVENPKWETLTAVANLSSETRQKLREDIGEVLLGLSRAVWFEAEPVADKAARADQARFGIELAKLAGRYLGGEVGSRAAAAQEAELTRLTGDDAGAQAVQERADALPMRTVRDHFLVAVRHLQRREFNKAMPLVQEATRLDPHSFWAWFYLGNCHNEQAQHELAISCYKTCLALNSDAANAFPPLFNRGLIYLRRGQFTNACADLDECIQLQPQFRDAYVQRGIAAKELAKASQQLAKGLPASPGKDKAAADAEKRLGEAEHWLSKALELDPNSAWVYFARADARSLKVDTAGAAADRSQGLRNEPSDALSWIERGHARLNSDPKAALADLEKGLELNPRAFQALQNKAHLLAEKLGRLPEAIEVLNKAITLYPGYTPARIGRGVVLARLGKRAEAHEDARAALAIEKTPLNLYQASNIYALTSRQSAEDKDKAIAFLAQALKSGYGLGIVESDRDMDPIREDPEFKRLVQAARELQSGCKAARAIE